MGSVDQFSDCAEAVHPSIVHPSCQAEPSSSSVARTRLISPMMTRHDGSRRSGCSGCGKALRGRAPGKHRRVSVAIKMCVFRLVWSPERPRWVVRRSGSVRLGCFCLGRCSVSSLQAPAATLLLRLLRHAVSGVHCVWSFFCAIFLSLSLAQLFSVSFR